MDLGDFHPIQIPTEWSVRQDLGKIDENVQGVISAWRVMAQNGEDPRPFMPVVARSFLGRLLRAYQYFQANPGELQAFSSKTGISIQEMTDALISRRNVLRQLRDADLSTKSKAVSVVNALEAAFPAPKSQPVTTPFFLDPLPQDW